jgi:hypothetical protein
MAGNSIVISQANSDFQPVPFGHKRFPLYLCFDSAYTLASHNTDCYDFGIVARTYLPDNIF